MHPSQPRRALLPIVALLYSATAWGVLWYPLRLLDQAGLHGLWSSLVLFGAALLAGGWVALRHLPAFVPAWRPLLGMTLANGWCNVAFIVAILDGSVVRVTLLFFLSPLWATLLARVLLGEQVSARAMGVLLLALGGAVVMLWDPQVGYPWPQDTADLLAISSGIAFALSNVFIRKTEHTPLALKTTCAWFGVALTAAVWLTLSQSPLPQVTPPVWVGAAALGMVGVLSMTIAVQYGVAHMPVHLSAVIMLFELVASAVSSQLLTDEVVSLREWIGGMLIVAAAWFAAQSHLDEQK